MRVLVLTTAYPVPGAPADGIFVREHALAAAEHAEVAVLHLDRRRGVGRPWSVRAVAGEPLPTWRASYPYRPLPVSVAAHQAAALAGYHAARFRPDVLHAHFFLAGLPAVLLGKALRKPVVVSEHWTIFLPEDPAPLTPALRLAAKLTFERADLVLPPSEALRAAIEAQGIRARFRIVPNVVDTALFHPDGERRAGPPRVLAVGLLRDAKGFDVLLRAARRLDESGRDFGLDLVGDGPLRGEHERLARELGIDHRVHFHGLLPKEEVARLMREADAFVLSSRYENNPVALIEALASGLPAVATAVGGVPELVDERNGALVRSGDDEALAAGIAELLDGLARFDRRAIAARARERFSRERIGRELAAAYADVLARRR